MPNNKKLGTAFEKELCKILAEHGFWCHALTQNAVGQPFDVIAALGGRAYPIDCKVCEHDRFTFSRIEENQRSAMTLWRETGNGNGWFALKLSDGSVYMLSLSTIEELERNFDVKSLNVGGIINNAYPLEGWVKR